MIARSHDHARSLTHRDEPLERRLRVRRVAEADGRRRRDGPVEADDVEVEWPLRKERRGEESRREEKRAGREQKESRREQKERIRRDSCVRAPWRWEARETRTESTTLSGGSAKGGVAADASLSVRTARSMVGVSLDALRAYESLARWIETINIHWTQKVLSK